MDRMNGFAIAPPPSHGEGFVELSRSTQGRIFEKHILNYGDLIYPGLKGGKVHIDDAFADALITNFSNRVCDIVQVPKAGPNNEHTEDPDRNIGEVVGVVKRNNKIYAQIDARVEADADKLGKTLIGASAMMHLNYIDTHTNRAVGPTLLHVAVTNRPYITKLEDFSEIIAASADGYSEAVFLSAPTKEKTHMDLDELIATLKSDHNIDVPALQLKASNVDTAVLLSNTVQEELVSNGILKLSNGEAATEAEIVGAITSAGARIVELSAKVDSLVEDGAKVEATARVAGLVREGRIIPANSDAQVRLLLSNAELFEELLPEKAIVALSNGEEHGFDGTGEEHDRTVADEVARLTNSDAAKAYIRS